MNSLTTHLRRDPLARGLLAIVALSLATAPSCRGQSSPATRPSEVKVTELPNHLHVELAGKPFTDYWFGQRPDRRFTRPFFSPVLASDGVDVTSDQYLIADSAHPHHQSLWVSHMKVNGVDHWSLLGKPEPARQRHVKFDSVDADGFVELLDWEDQDPSKLLLHEKRTVRFGQLSDGTRTVHLTVALTPAGGKVVLGDAKDAGLCSVRVAMAVSGTDKHPPAEEKVSNSTSAVGEPACWGKAADWCDISGAIDGKPYGVAIFDYPKNPRHPTTWHVRQYGLLCANPFGLHDFDPKHAAPDAGDFPIEPGQTATFRYLVVVHTGDAASAKLDEKYKMFAAE